MLRRRSFSVFTTLFILYSLLILILCAVLIGIFQNYMNRSTEVLIQSKQVQAQNVLKTLEQQFDAIYQHEINLANSTNVRKLAYQVYEDNYERTQLILTLQRTIEGIQGMSPLIKEIVISFPSEGMAVSSVVGYMKETMDSLPSQGEGGDEFNYFMTFDGEILMNFSYPLTYSENSDYIPDFNIRIILSQELLAETLTVFHDERGSGGSLLFRLDTDVFIGSGPGSPAEGLHTLPTDYRQAAEDYQFSELASLKYPLSIISFINRQLIREIRVKYITLLASVVLILSALYAFSLIYTRRIVVRPLKELMNAFGSIQNGDFTVRIYHAPHDEFDYLYTHFNDSVSYIEKLIEDIREQEKLLQNAELAQLQSQINPHFLYNSFFIINRMAKNEAYDQITKFVTSLAKYYRFINKETHNFIPLCEEVAHMMNYIDIQQMRFEDKISVKAEPLPPEAGQILVPKLILQPIIENAYSYGLGNKLSGGLISIRYRREHSLLNIIIEDNGEDADDELIEQMRKNLAGKPSENENHALININSRLLLAYGDGCGVYVNLSPLGGVQIVLTVREGKEHSS